MEGRKYDFVVFGATGFTGQYTVDEVARVAEEENLKWAVAGRNMEKLQKVLSEASARTGKDLEETPIVIADTSSPNSLLDMAKDTKLVLNCVGPYRFYGEPVVKACIEAGTHHLDISGEPQYLEKMQLLYNGKAKEKGIYIIGSVGFDSIPAEMGIVYTKKQFEEAEADLTNVESFFHVKAGPEGVAANFGTFESAVHGVANWNELKPLRKSLYPEPMPKYETRLPKKSALHFDKAVNKWCLPFLGSDRSVVYRTNRDLLDTGRLSKPFEFQPYWCQDSLFKSLGMIIFAMVFGIMSYTSFGRSLLLRYPQIFTLGTFKRGGPTKKQIDGTSFSMTFVGYGFDKKDTDRAGKKPTKQIVTKIVAPEPGYVTTPICMVQAAVTVLKGAKKFHHKGGVLTPGAAFWESDLVERLQKHNVKFMTVSDGSTSDKTE